MAGLAGGIALLVAFGIAETRIAEPMFQLSLFRIRAFTAGNLAGLAVSVARGGLQFMLIIWLLGIWLPRHGYDYRWLPRLGPGVGPAVRPVRLSRHRHRRDGCVRGSFIGLMLLPVNFPYWAFVLISAPFHHGLTVVFAVSAGLAVLAALASLLRGGRSVHPEVAAGAPEPRTGTPVKSERGTST